MPTDDKEVTTSEKKAPQKNSHLVLDLTHKKLNQIIRKEIESIPTNDTSVYNYKYRNKWLQGRRYCLFEKASEFEAAFLSNEIQIEKDTNTLFIPVDLRAHSRTRKISDLKNKFEQQFWKGKWRNNKFKPLHVVLQKKGGDITLHTKGSTRTKEGTFKSHHLVDVKLDYYAGKSGRIPLECYLCDSRSVFEKKGWIWNEEVKYLIFFVDDEMLVLDHHKMRELVEKAGEPVLRNHVKPDGTTIKVVEGNYDANTYSDNYDPKTGEGKYNYYVSLEDARSMALRVVPVSDAYLSFIANRAEAYRELQGSDLPYSQDGWLDRMVCKNEERQQRGA